MCSQFLSYTFFEYFLKETPLEVYQYKQVNVGMLR